MKLNIAVLQSHSETILTMSHASSKNATAALLELLLLNWKKCCAEITQCL